ncbi:MAG: hypothetical protein LH628_14240 [Microcoleus sp. CAN_BIN18]|nr:hypothetical protein [Microcoleus sp. CAN_BIN18]
MTKSLTVSSPSRSLLSKSRRQSENVDLIWKPETGFLSLYQAAKPNIFSMFILIHLVQLNRSLFNPV